MFQRYYIIGECIVIQQQLIQKARSIAMKLEEERSKIILTGWGIEAQVQLSKLLEDTESDMQHHGNPMISIVIPNKDHYKDLDLCVTSVLKKSIYRNFEIIIVENNSTEKRNI